MSSVPTSSIKSTELPPRDIATSAAVPGIAFTPANLYVWGKKSALSLIDQAFTSGANFGVNLVLARWLTGEAYGAFAVAFAAYIFVAGFHTVLLLEPLSVMGPSRHSARLAAYFRSQILVHVFLTGVLSLAALAVTFGLWKFVPSNPLIQAILGVGITVPFLLLLWLARRMCYVVQRPSVAVLGSGFYLVFLFACLYWITHVGRLTALTAFLCMGLASLVASGPLFWSLGLLHSRNLESPGGSWRGALAENWKYGRWLVGSTVLYSALSQTQTFLVAAWFGLGAAGILRAMQLPGFVMSQVVVATGLLFLPVFSSDFGRGAITRMRHKAMLVSVGLTIATLCFAIVLQIFASPVEHLFYGGKYAAYAWLMPLLALVPAANAFSTGYSMALRSSQQPHFDLVSNAAVAPVALLGAFLLIYKWGLIGAAFSMVLSFVLLSVMTFACFQWFSRGSRSAIKHGSMFGNSPMESAPAPIRQPAQEDSNGY